MFNLFITYLVTIGIIVNCSLVYAESLNSKQPVEINADEMVYEKSIDAMVAHGDVIVEQDHQKLRAEDLYYFRSQDKILARNNVYILREDGTEFFADKLDADRSLYKGKALGVYSRGPGTSLLAAASTEMINRDRMFARNAVYSTCKVCKGNLFSYTPIWQIKAKEAKLNKKEQKIVYKHARFEAFGVPVFYTPYLVTPSPNAKRKSGILFPTFRFNEHLGTSVRVPYYLNIKPNIDATITPWFNSEKDMVWEGQFRHLHKYGRYQLDGSITKDYGLNKLGIEDTNKKVDKSHLNVDAQFNLPNNYADIKYGVLATRLHDKARTYLNKYKLSNENVLKQDFYVRSSWDKGYLYADSIYFQSLRPADNWATTPRVLPWFRNQIEFDSPIENSTFTLKNDFINLFREIGGGYKRFSSSLSYSLPVQLSYGQLLTLEASMRGDYYDIETKQQPIYSRKGRLYPKASATWSLPLINYTAFGTFIIEPVVNLIVSKRLDNDDKIPNEDSEEFELSAFNLFDSNRFLGLDRIESGSRVNYGVKASYASSWMRYLEIQLGRVYNVESHHYSNESGLKGENSDYVAALKINPISNFYILDKLRLSEKNGKLMRHDLNLIYAYKKWQLNLNYNEVDKSILDTKYTPYRKDVSAAVKYNLYDKWWIGAKTKRKFGKKVQGISQKISDGATVDYLGNCLHILFNVERDYTKLKDLKPSTTYSLNIQIPTF